MPEIVFLILILLAVVVGVVLILRSLKRPAQGDGQSLVMLQNQITELNRVLDSKLSESSQAMREHMVHSLKQLQEIAQNLVRVDEGQKQVISLSGDLQKLQDILKNKKSRGALGEYYLETTLGNVLPPTGYKMQYAFKNGEIVDAVVFCDDQIIPIDSKFSVENYNRMIDAPNDQERKQYADALVADLKKRIDETAKYIPASEGACELALMYVPSEAVFYDLIVNPVGTAITNRSLLEYAAEKKVTIVSPTLFYVFLQTILQSLRQRDFNRSAEEIRRRVIELSRHLVSYETYMKKLGDHLGTSVKMYSSAYHEFQKIDKDVMKISGEAMNIEPVAIEQPVNIEK